MNFVKNLKNMINISKRKKISRMNFKHMIKNFQQIKYKNIIISPRNKKKALYLKKYFKRVIIAKDNQEVINKADWIFLGILPKVGESILPKLKFRNKWH